MSNQNLDDFSAHLLAEGKSAGTVQTYLKIVRHFLKHIGETRVERISEEMARSYFATIKNKHSRCCAANVISMYLRFAAARLPVPVTRGPKASRASAPVPAKLQQRWSVDKLLEQKTKDDDLIAKLARKVIDAYLLCGRAIKGDFNLDDFVRYHDEARDLIESNLTLFMGLSASGRNIHSAIDERVNR
jgi:hypothetical protein